MLTGLFQYICNFFITLSLFRFFQNSKNTSDILNLPERFLIALWDMLTKLNSTTKMIDVLSFRELARDVFRYYIEVVDNNYVCSLIVRNNDILSNFF